jgi:hypothetical protein
MGFTHANIMSQAAIEKSLISLSGRLWNIRWLFSCNKYR